MHDPYGGFGHRNHLPFPTCMIQLLVGLCVNGDVPPPRLHAAGLVMVLHVHPELEVVRCAGGHAAADELLLAVDEHGHRRRADVVDHVQPEPPVVDVRLDGGAAVVLQRAVVDVQHQRGGGHAAVVVVDLHHRCP
jgi:hypothetical protein